MNRSYLTGLSAASVLLLSAAAHGQDNFADSVTASSSLVDPNYNSTGAVLGAPTTRIATTYDNPPVTNRSLVFSAFGTAPDGSALVTRLGQAQSTNNAAIIGSITVKFDQPIVHDPSHWYGEDFIVFGNSAFTGDYNDDGYVSSGTDMANYHLSDGSTYGATPFTVSVSQDGVNFYTYPQPTTEAFPENAFSWDRTTHAWGGLLDFTKPVDPTLTPGALAGLSVADAIDRYKGSAGGTAFTLPAQMSSISYIRVTSAGGVIDGFSRVSAAPEPGIMCVFAVGAAGLTLLVRRRLRHAESVS